MKKLLFASLIFLNYHFLFSQHDSLAKYSYEDLRLKLVRNIEKDKAYNLYLDYYITRAKKENNIEYLIKGYGFKVEHYPYKEAIRYADSMFYLVKNKAPNLSFLYYYKIGNLYAGNRKNKKALDSYLLAYNKCDKNDAHYCNAIKTQIGVMRSALGQYKEAIEILKETKENYEKDSQSYYLFHQYIMAEAYNSCYDLESSKKIIDKGLILAKKLNSTEYYDRLIMTRGVNLYLRKEYRLALNNLLPLFKNDSFIKEDHSDYAFVSYYIGKSYEGLNNKELALTHFKKVDSILLKHKDIYNWNIDCYKSVISYYKEKNDLKNQLVYTERLIKADSLLMASNEYGLKKLNKEYDMPNLIRDKEQLIQKLNTRDQFTKAFLFLCLFVLGIGTYLYLKNKKKYKEKIEMLQNDLDNYLSIQHKNFEDKNKIITYEKTTLNPIAESQGKMADDTKTKIIDCLDIFEKNKDFLKNNCSLETLAKEFNTNKTYLSKIINEEKKYSFSTYISNLRIDYFIELIKEDKKIRKYSIESIAEELGYNNAKAFSKAFNDRIGVNPSVFIKNLKS